MRVGLDFDNTIVGYDDVFCFAARKARLVPESFSGGKTAVKSHLLTLPDGGTEWMRLQGQVYGALMDQAVMMKGVDGFLHKARELGADVFVVSHKTTHGHFDVQRVDLRRAARSWLEGRGFFSKEGYGISPENVYFEDTRVAKVARIAVLKLDVFVDDLAEVFEEPEFPDVTRKLLLGEAGRPVPAAWQICPDWAAVHHAVFES
jgi:hypothetical protein